MDNYIHNKLIIRKNLLKIPCKFTFNSFKKK